MPGEDYLQALIDKNRAFVRFLPTILLALLLPSRKSIARQKAMGER